MGDSRKTGSSRSVQYGFRQGRTLPVLRFHIYFYIACIHRHHACEHCDQFCLAVSFHTGYTQYLALPDREADIIDAHLSFVIYIEYLFSMQYHFAWFYFLLVYLQDRIASYHQPGYLILCDVFRS